MYYIGGLHRRFLIFGFLVLCGLAFQALGSIHEYENQVFASRSNSFFVHGGNEGLYGSKVVEQINSSSYDGKPFIRYSILFISSRWSMVDFTSPACLIDLVFFIFLN